MSDVTRVLSQIEDGDANAAERLLPLVYDELRKLAAQKMAQEAPSVFQQEPISASETSSSDQVIRHKTAVA